MIAMGQYDGDRDGVPGGHHGCTVLGERGGFGLALGLEGTSYCQTVSSDQFHYDVRCRVVEQVQFPCLVHPCAMCILASSKTAPSVTRRCSSQ